MDGDSSREDVIRDCLKTIDLDGNLVAMDADGLCVMEIDDFEPLRGQPWASFWPEETQGIIAGAVRTASGGRVARFSAVCPTARGTMKTWDVSVSPIRDASGAVVALQSLSQDISQGVHDQRETALVSRELVHRLKNLFAMIDGLITLSARNEPEAASFVKGLRARLAGIDRAVSYIHPTGAPGDTDGTSLKPLISAILAPYEMTGTQIAIEGEDVSVSSSIMTSLALILNELTTNAVKYGALHESQGQLTVRLSRAEDTFVIDWTETGSKLATKRDAPAGFGTSLLDRTIRSQLQGTIERRWSDHGLNVRIAMPAARLSLGA